MNPETRVSGESTDGKVKEPPPKRKTIGKTVGIVVALAAIIGVGYGTRLTDYLSLDNLDVLRDWIDGFGAIAPVVFVAVYAVAVVAFLPATPLTLLAGLVFGAVWGTLWA